MAATGRMNQREFRAFNRLTARNTRDLLKSGFLDTLGTPTASVEVQRVGDGLGFASVEEVLRFYGEQFLRGFADELDKADANASGALTDSMRFEIERKGRGYEVRFIMADYAKFVDEGVQGIDRGKSVNKTSPYKFKFRRPSKKHIDALEAWIREKNVTALIVAPKGINTGDMKPRDLATAMGYAIKKRGLRATYFKRKTIESLVEDFKADIAKAMDVDVKVNILFE